MPELSLSSEELPRAHVLSYVTSATTPTRVRLIAARVTLLAGLLNAIVALCVLAVAGQEIYQRAVIRANPMLVFVGGAAMPPPARPLELRDFIGAFNDYVRDQPIWAALMAGAVGSAILLLVVAPPIKRGRRAASILALLYFAPAAAMVGLIALLFIAVCFTEQFMRSGQLRDWWALWWLLLIPVAALPPVLLKDVCAFLLWIARHPIAEKPPVPFLPTTVRA